MTYINVPFIMEDMPEAVAVELFYAIKRKLNWGVIAFTKLDIVDVLEDNGYDVTDENIELVQTSGVWKMLEHCCAIEGMDTLGYLVREVMTSKEANEG
jgi:uncharacterized membrane protein YuzA (DUF378 family)